MSDTGGVRSLVTAPMTDAISPPPVPAGSSIVDSAGLVIADLPCRKCSYNVRGLPVASRCPECGAPVGVSVNGDLLRYSEPQWLQNLSKGAAFAFWGVLVSMVATIVGGIIAQVTVPLMAPIATMVGGLVYLYGAWLLTEPDPSGLGEDQYGRARQIIRIALIAGLVGAGVEAINATLAPEPTLRIALGIVSVAVGLVGVAGQFATLRYLQRLALRIPDDRLSARAKLVFWGYGLSLAAMIVVGGVMMLVIAGSGIFASGPNSPAPGGGVVGTLAGAGCAVGIAFLAMLGFGIIFLVLLFQLKRAFAQQAEVARQVWSAQQFRPDVDLGKELAIPADPWGKMAPP